MTNNNKCAKFLYDSGPEVEAPDEGVGVGVEVEIEMWGEGIMTEMGDWWIV